MITLLKTESPKPKQIHIDTRKVIGLNSTPYVNVDVAQIGERVIRVKNSKICVIISQKAIEEISFEELQQTMKELLDLASNVVDLKRFNKEPVVSSTT